MNFNSRPREGADHLKKSLRRFFVISTHGPARGPTEDEREVPWWGAISTHGPARGPTQDP